MYVNTYTNFERSALRCSFTISYFAKILQHYVINSTPLPNAVQTPHIPPVKFHVEQLSLSRVVAPESEGYIARSEFGALWFHFPSPGFMK